MQEKAKHRWIFLVVLATILTMVGVTFYRYMVLSEYDIFTDETEIPGQFDFLKSNT